MLVSFQWLYFNDLLGKGYKLRVYRSKKMIGIICWRVVVQCTLFLWVENALLKWHRQLWDRADLDTSFLTLKPNLESKLRVEYFTKSASIFAVFCSIFNRLLKNPVFECAFAHHMISFYHIWFKKYGARLQKNMKWRGGKLERAGRKKISCIACNNNRN